MTGFLRGLLVGFMLGLAIVYGAEFYRAALFH